MTRNSGNSRLAFATGCIVLLFAGLMSDRLAAQNANDGFDPNANASVRAAVVQPDGKIIVGGDFTTIGGQTRNRIARLNPDGSLDSGFAAVNIDARVRVIALQADGRIVIGGDFALVGGLTRNRIARLNADGTLDPAFNPNANSVVLALVVQADGKVVVGGDFTVLGGQTRNRIARLNADGSLDSAFNPNANNFVNSLALQANGKLILGGAFTSIAGQVRNRLVRLNADGSLDTPIDLNVNAVVGALVVQPDGKLVLGGQFTSVAGQVRNRIARLNADLSLDTGFNPNASSAVNALAVQADGKLVLGGAFTSIGGQPRNYIARLDANASLDAAFNPNANFDVYTLAVQPDGKLAVGGIFAVIAGQPRNNIARLQVDGRADTAFFASANNFVRALAVQADGRLLVGGSFTILGGLTRNFIARMNADGGNDVPFNPNANSEVRALAVQPDGKVVVGGFFTTIAGQPRNRIARLNPDGSLDPGFNPDANSAVYAIAVQPDGKLVVGGGFGIIAGQGRNRIARLNPDGSLDPGFNPNANSAVHAIAAQPDGKLVVGGAFTTIAGQPRNYIARLNANGSPDTAFNPNASGFYVEALAVLPDGKLVVGGSFGTIAGQTRFNLARLNSDGTLDGAFAPNPVGGAVVALAVQADGKLVIGGAFNSISGQTRNYIARLNADGSLDSAFDPNASLGVFALGVLGDGKLMVGGDFTAIGGQLRNRIARLSTPQAALQSLDIVDYSSAGSTVTWNRIGAGPELALPPQMQFSLTDSGYSTAGTMQRVSGGWRYVGFVPPLSQNFFLRARGQVGTGGMIESTRQFFLARIATSSLLQAPALPPPPASSRLAGSSVAVARQVVVLGAPGSLVNGAGGGQVFVYSAANFAQVAGSPPWAAEAKSGWVRKDLVGTVDLATLQLPVGTIGDKFGQVAVSRDGSTVVVGAPGVSSARGAIYVFHEPVGGWIGTVLPSQTLVPPLSVAGDEIGAAVTMTNAGTVLVGAPGASVSDLPGAGKVFVMRPLGNGNFMVAETLTSPQPQFAAQFGAAIDGDGAEAVVGSPGQSVDGQSDHGVVVTFREPANGSPYAPRDMVVDPSGSLGDKFGTSVAIADGMLVVGAPGSDQDAADVGAAVIFDQASTGTMLPVATLSQPGASEGSALGTAVALQGQTIAAAAPLADVNGNVDQGLVVVYVPAAPELPITGTIAPTAILFDPSGQPGDQFGADFDLDETLAIAGVPYHETAATAGLDHRKGVDTNAAGQGVVYTDDVLYRDGLETLRGQVDGCIAPNLAIPDNTVAGVNSDLTLAAAGAVRDVDIYVRVAHTHASDLRLTLRHVPTGRSVPLYVPTSACPTNNLDVDFDDQAVDGYARDQCSAGSPAVSGVRLPNDWLLRMQGAVRTGPWRLNVADAKAGDIGVLQQWCVEAR